MCAITRSERLIEDSFVRFPIGAVAPAGSGLESTPVENRDIAAAVLDQIPPLQGTGRIGDADSADAEHEGQEFLGDMESVGVCTILRH